MSNKEVDIPEERVKRWLGEAEGYLDLGLFDLAEERLCKATKSQHWPYESQMLMGRFFRDQSRFGEGVPCFERALVVKPGDVAATVGLGWCLKRSGRVDAAARAYEAALKINDEDSLLHYNLACYLSLLGQITPAISELTKAIKLDTHYRKLAQEESDFDPIRELPMFKQLITEPKSDETIMEA